MKLSKHIAYEFLTKDFLWKELANLQINEAKKKNSVKELDIHTELAILTGMMPTKEIKRYLVSKSVISLFSDFKVDKADWKMFAEISKEQKVFILPNDSMVMLTMDGDLLRILELKSIQNNPKENTRYHLGWVNIVSGETSTAFLQTELFIFKLLCFMFLTENEELILPSKQKYGTKKTAEKILNDTPFSVTIVNSKWHKTVIRTEGFAVRGHFALRKTGAGRTQSKIVFIEPYEKTGYKRTY